MFITQNIFSGSGNQLLVIYIVKEKKKSRFFGAGIVTDCFLPKCYQEMASREMTKTTETLQTRYQRALRDGDEIDGRGVRYLLSLVSVFRL